MRIEHDRLFKELLRTFFAEFMDLFFQEVYEAIDFNHVAFLSEEVFTDVVVGEVHKVDVLIETKLKDKDALIIVHFESQAQFQEKFAERMFIYSSRLYAKYRKPIIPIVIFSYDQVKEEPDHFVMRLPFIEILSFQFFKLELRKKNWRDFIEQDNPVAAALLSKMGYTKEDRVQVKKEFLRMLVRLHLDPARMRLISGFFDTYLKLDDIEEIQLQKEIAMLEPHEEEKIMDLRTNWEKTAELNGELKGEQKILKKFLKAHFGDDSRVMLEQIDHLTDLDILEQLTDQLFQNSDFSEAKKLVSEAYNKRQSLI
ncbi:transposase [Paenibacillus psychroresistens]|uniref:Transposase n=1 Tax=Paenibacillus psychroresistens TaxID=1778678 RepID=A0A6B8RCN8_9BACL|nr:transposase [Paenibacillus psychroresistens]QGQ93574.1 transposase [Paenibacillus psychroresistens]